MLIIRSMGNADNINNSVFINFFIPPTPLNDNLVSQKLLIGSIENYNANTRILLNESIFKFSVLIICFTINNRASTIVIEKDYLIKSKCVSYIFASFENVAIGSVHYVDSTHIYLENGFDELQIYGLQ